MKIKHTIVAGLLAVMTAFLIGPTPPAYAQDLTAPVAAAEQFDGKKQYKEVFERLRDTELSLTETTKMNEWAAEWENKFDGTDKLDTEEGAVEAINEMVHSLLQIHNAYMTPEHVEAFQQSIDPSITGIGQEVAIKGMLQALRDLPDNATEAEVKEAVTIRADKPLVAADAPMGGMPADKAGLLQGDEILEVDGVSLNGLTLEEAVDKIKGPENTTVTLTIRRDDGQGGTTTFDVPIVRAKVTPKVTKVKDLGNGVTHVRLRSFMSEHLEAEMEAALKQAAGGKALILDLRGNTGGRLDAAITLAGNLMSEGTVLVQRQRHDDHYHLVRTTLGTDYVLVDQSVSNDPTQRQMQMGDRSELLIPDDMPIIVLIDGGSASASEILAGALQESGRAQIVGTPTFGKGVGQSVMRLSYGRALRVTTFEFLPGGEPMDMVGIIPDVTVEQPEDDRFDRDKDTQLERALELALEAIQTEEARDAKAEELRTEKLDAWKKATGQIDDTGNGATQPSGH